MIGTQTYSGQAVGTGAPTETGAGIVVDTANSAHAHGMPITTRSLRRSRRSSLHLRCRSIKAASKPVTDSRPSLGPSTWRVVPSHELLLPAHTTAAPHAAAETAH
jgi:hypothetical protein